MSSAPQTEAPASEILQFDDNGLLPMLYGEHDQHLARMEQQLGVSLVSRGNRLAISGPPDLVSTAGRAMTALYERLKKGLQVDGAEVDAVLRMARHALGP